MDVWITIGVIIAMVVVIANSMISSLQQYIILKKIDKKLDIMLSTLKKPVSDNGD